jgi:hypothetical protein
MLPKIKDPMGRTKNEEPTMAKVSKNAVSLEEGKSWLLNNLAKITAKNKSYHSNKVPVAEAIIAVFMCLSVDIAN